VLGDLQVTGKVAIEGLTFVVVGESKILDDAHFKDVTLFSTKRISIENKAVFSGTAITLANLIVSGNGTVENRSMLVIAHGFLHVQCQYVHSTRSPGKALYFLV